MKKIVKALTCIMPIIMSFPVHSAVTVDFWELYYAAVPDDPFAIGSFAGEDGNLDGLITIDELTSFTYLDLGSEIPASLADLIHFGDFNITTEMWIPNAENSDRDLDNAFFTTYYNFLGTRQIWSITAANANGLGGIVLKEVNLSSVPLPGAAWLFGTGLVGLVGMRTNLSKRK